MAAPGIRFIRRNGHIIPIGTKGKASDWKTRPPRTIKRDITTRAVSGAETAFKFGAVVGGVVGAGYGFSQGKSLMGSIAKAISVGAGSSVITGLNWAPVGALAGAAFGKRSTRTNGQSYYMPKQKKNKTGV